MTSFFLHASYINAKCFEFLSGGEIDDMFVDASLALKQFLVKQVESHTRPGLGVYRHSKLIGMPGRDTDMTCNNVGLTCIMHHKYIFVTLLLALISFYAPNSFPKNNL